VSGEKDDMKFDKETVWAIVFCVAFIFAWGPISRKLWPPKPRAAETASGSETTDATGEGVATVPDSRPETAAESSAASSGEAVAVPDSGEGKGGKSEKAASSVAGTVEEGAIVSTGSVGDLPLVHLSNDCVDASIDLNSGAVVAVELKKFLDADKKKNVVMLRHVSGGALGILPGKGEWTLLSSKTNILNGVAPRGSPVVLRREFRVAEGARFAVVQRWFLSDHYVVSCEIELENLSDTPVELGSILVGAGGMSPIKHMAGDKVLRETFDLDYFDLKAEKVKSESAVRGGGFFAKIFGGEPPEKEFSEERDVKAKWVGAANRYFASILVSGKTPFDGVVLSSDTKKLSGNISLGAKESKGKKDRDYQVASAKGVVAFGTLEPSARGKMTFQYFAGPKDIRDLNRLDPDASKIMKLYFLGMIFLEPLSRLLLKVLLYLQGWCGSYGLSIIILTFIVKTIFWPVTHKANVSMRKMQKIQPLIQELRKKYKDDQQRLSLETMKLYKEHKVNPLGGCLPILLQMPVFFALYAMLSGTVDPRQTSFLWMSDLSLPDTIFVIPGINLPIRPLMLMMTGTMVLQQKLTPSTAEPAQQKMMMMMPVVMLVMLYGLPSGLTLYWTVSQFISISQLIVNKQLEKRAALKEEGAA